jgi:hypothetical protein
MSAIRTVVIALADRVIRQATCPVPVVPHRSLNIGNAMAGAGVAGEN